MKKPVIRVFIADDHAIVREGLKQILAEQRDIVVAGEAENGLDADQAVPQSRRATSCCSTSRCPTATASRC